MCNILSYILFVGTIVLKNLSQLKMSAKDEYGMPRYLYFYANLHLQSVIKY